VVSRPPWAQPEGTEALSSIKPIPTLMAFEFDYCHRLIRDRKVVIETVHRVIGKSEHGD
jgi:hypothetical protein